MSELISDILHFYADNHGNILTKDQHMAIIGKKDEVIQDLSRRMMLSGRSGMTATTLQA
jgi:hypothetical protein